MAKRKHCYAVCNGRQTGIFYEWETCREQVQGRRGAKYKGFKTVAEAESYLAQNGIVCPRKNETSQDSRKEDATDFHQSTVMMDVIRDVFVDFDGTPATVPYLRKRGSHHHYQQIPLLFSEINENALYRHRLFSFSPVSL